jgi:serine phosphatase RsbU (regulator of sigma subunit)
VNCAVHVKAGLSLKQSNGEQEVKLMATRDLGKIRKSLAAQHQAITDWMANTPAEKRSTRLGPEDETAVQEHIEVINSAAEKAANQTLGICKVCHQTVDDELLEMDYTAEVCLAHFSEEELRQLEMELELSQTVQKSLLPQQVPSIPGLDIAVFSRPAQILGGDYFDFLRYRDGAHGLAIADVMGHGMSAGLLMASVQTALRTFIPGGLTPGDVARRMNRFFLHNIHRTTFVTLMLARYEVDSRTFQYCNAGHNPPLLHRPTGNGGGSSQWLMPTSAAIGLSEKFRAGMETVTLLPGDLLLLYTDGVTEAVNPHGEEFGAARLEETVRQNAHLAAKDVVRAVRQAVQDFAAGKPLFDDTTLVACKAAA